MCYLEEWTSGEAVTDAAGHTAGRGGHDGRGGRAVRGGVVAQTHTRAVGAQYRELHLLWLLGLLGLRFLFCESGGI